MRDDIAADQPAVGEAAAAVPAMLVLGASRWPEGRSAS
jgi:hypothetical protein